MVADLYQSRIAYEEREIPWHKAGTPFSGDISMADALDLSRTDYEVVLGEANAYEIINPDGTRSGNYVSGDSIDSKSNGIAVLRAPSYDDPNWAVLGKATERFTIVQNKDLAHMVEDFRQFGRIETIGALGSGERFFVCFEGGNWDVRLLGDKKDAQKAYLIVKNNHIPGETLQFQLTTVRLVCANTWVAGDSAALFNLPLAHFSDIHMIAKWVTEALMKAPEAIKKQQEAAERMARIQVTDKIVKTGIEYAIPMPQTSKVVNELKLKGEMPGLEKVLIEAQDMIARKNTQLTVMQERILRQREAALRTYHEGDNELDRALRGTAWGAFQAIAASIDWTVRTPRNVKQTSKSLQSSVFGEKMQWKQNAYNFFANEEKWETA